MNATVFDHVISDNRRAAVHRGSVVVRTAKTVRSIVLRVPLLWKLLGANVGLVAAMLLAHIAFPSTSRVAELIVLLALSFAATGVLVWLALRPVADVEATAARVSEGDYAARVPPSSIADHGIARLSTTMNRLLDRVDADRKRIHYLAGRNVRARDIERQSVARELRESFAQQLAGVAMQLAVAQQATEGTAFAAQLEQSRAMLCDLTEEMRSVAETLYPGTLEEFGLLNAIEALSRRVSRRSSIQIQVNAVGFMQSIPSRAGSALYRVAEETLRNVEQHAQASHVRMTLTTNGVVTLEVDDDGRGIDMTLNDPLQAGLGLFSAKAVLALVGGELQISSGPGLGTRVSARVPVRPTPQGQ